MGENSLHIVPTSALQPPERTVTNPQPLNKLHANGWQEKTYNFSERKIITGGMRNARNAGSKQLKENPYRTCQGFTTKMLSTCHSVCQEPQCSSV